MLVPPRALALISCFMCVSANAQMLTEQGPPLHRLVHRNLFAARLNPLGLFYEGRVTYRLRLYQTPSVALRDNFIGVGVIGFIAPSYFRIGAIAEFNPVTFFGLWASAQYVQYFGIINSLQSFESANTKDSEATIQALGDLPKDDVHHNYASKGFQLAVGASAQFKVGPMALREQLRLTRGAMQLRPGDRTFYDAAFDVSAPNFGWYMNNDVDVLWQGLPQNALAIGARYTFTMPFYTQARDVLPGETVPDDSMHRVGPFVAYTFKNKDGALFNNPTLLVLVQWWLKHPWRAGVEQSAALPLFGLAFQFNGDFLPVTPEAAVKATSEALNSLSDSAVSLR